jgi:putative hemolysin
MNKTRVDVESVIAGKNPKLLKIIPKFIFSWLKRLIHQNDINNILSKYGHLEGVPFASSALEEMNITYTLHGLDNIAEERRYIIVSNHPLGGLDGLILTEAFGRIFNSVKFVVNDLLYSIDPLKPVFIPVNKYGRQTTGAAEMIHESYSSGDQILYFPAGLCSRLVKGKIEDLEWKKSYLNQALKYKRDILPVYFEGRNSGLFYRIANLRKRLGIKFNYETILLPHEMFRQQNNSFNVYIGKPFTCEELLSGKSVNEWNNLVRERVYSLKTAKWNR